jgi:hypothetical protein
MSIETALARGRAAAEALQVDACVIKRRTGETTSGGVITPTWSTLYTGKCRIQTRQLEGQGRDVGEAYVVLERREIQLPITATGLQEGDQATITASALDPDLVGRVYTIRTVTSKTHLTSRRAEIIEVTS